MSTDTKIRIPFLSFDAMNALVRNEVLEAFQSFFDSNRFVLGAQTELFEKEYALFNKCEHCVGVSNGLDALHLALTALDIGIGDEVIVPSNTLARNRFLSNQENPASI